MTPGRSTGKQAGWALIEHPYNATVRFPDYGRSDRFFVDIEPDVDFSFVHMVCWSVRLFHSGDSERVFAQYGVVLADRPSRAARVL